MSSIVALVDLPAHYHKLFHYLQHFHVSHHTINVGYHLDEEYSLVVAVGEAVPVSSW